MVRFDHALIFVRTSGGHPRLHSFGFRVASGGAHDGDPTTNALVPFADGSYLELIAFRRRRTLALLRMLARSASSRARRARHSRDGSPCAPRAAPG